MKKTRRLIAGVVGGLSLLGYAQAQQQGMPPVKRAEARPAPDAGLVPMDRIDVHPDEKGASADLRVVAGASGQIFDAVLVRKITTTPPGMSVLVTQYEFQVHQWFKGAQASTRVIVRETGGVDAEGNGMAGSESHKLTEGGRYLVFLDENAAQIFFPFRRVLQIFDAGMTVADERGCVVIGLREGALVTRLEPEVPSLNYLGTRPTTQRVDVGPPTFASEPLPPQPAREKADAGPISAEEVFNLLRPLGQNKVVGKAPAGISTATLGGPDWNWCGYRTVSYNLACWLPDNNNFNWFNDAEFDWDNAVNYSGSGGWLFGFATSGGNPIRNELPVANNGRSNGAVPSDAQMIAGGYGSWAANGSPNGICFYWWTGNCGRITEADIFVNPVNAGDELQFRKSVVHEMGHALGLGHEDRYLADMVSGTWRAVPNYVLSSYYLKLDDLQGGRSMMAWANANAGASWSQASWRDIQTVGQTHPNAGTSGDIGPNVTTLSTFAANVGQTIQINRMHVENRGTAGYGGAVTLKIYFSTNNIISSADYEVWSGGWGSYPAEGASYNFSLNITIPTTIPTGNYYIGWILTSGETQLTSSNDTAIMTRDSGGNFAQRTIAVTNNVPANDACFNATPIGVGSYFGATTAATNDGSASCGSSTSSPDVWYSFLAPCGGTLVVDTCGSNYDTVISVHTACPGTAANEIGCNDDDAFCGGNPPRQSYLAVPVNGGQTYYIRVTGYLGLTGNYALGVNFAANVPANDDCGSAVFIGNGSVNGSTICASTDGNADCGTSSASPDVWYAYTPTISGALHVDTCGSGYDTVISVHTGCPGTIANIIGCDDDGCGYPYSSLDVPVTGGNTYYIRVSGYNGLYGNFTLNTSFVPVNDSCSNALPIANGTTPFTNIGATTDGPTEPSCSFCCGDLQVNQDVWYVYTATCTGNATISLCGSDYDTKVAIYSGTTCPTSPGTAIACNDDFCSVQSETSWAVTSGHTYLVRVGGYLSGTGSGTITLSCAATACYANCDNSTTPPILNVNDFICFQTKYAAGDPYANCDNSTTPPILNVNDFICFQTKFAAGCP